jgi:hypothetical protein
MTKCLVKKAKEECQCIDCKNYRIFREDMINQAVRLEIMKGNFQALKDTGLIKEK